MLTEIYLTILMINTDNWTGNKTSNFSWIPLFLTNFLPQIPYNTVSLSVAHTILLERGRQKGRGNGRMLYPVENLTK